MSGKEERIGRWRRAAAAAADEEELGDFGGEVGDLGAVERDDGSALPEARAESELSDPVLAVLRGLRSMWWFNGASWLWYVV